MRFGRYELLERIGQGGMAEVWRARLLGPAGYARTFAVKRILATHGGDRAIGALFVREARVMSRLRHRGIVQVFELDEVDGQPFLAMEFVNGISAFELVRGLPPAEHLDAGLCALIVQELCYALAYLHALGDEDGSPLGLVHRDVAPNNVMISVEGVVKLLDFGIAKPADRDALTGAGVVRGKPGYMAPEQLRGFEIDRRADVYAAGVVLWELLVAQRLFKDDGARAVPAPSSLRDGVPSALDLVCARALAPEREDRYAGAGEMADALAAVARGLGARSEGLAALVRARRPAPVSRRAADRRAWLVGLGVVVAIGAAVAVHHRSTPALVAPPAPSVAAVLAPPVAAPVPSSAPSPAPVPRGHAKPHRPATGLRDLSRGQIVDPFHGAGDAQKR